MPRENKYTVNLKNMIIKDQQHQGQPDEDDENLQSTSQLDSDQIPAEIQSESESPLQPESSSSSSYQEKSKKNKKKNKKKSKANDDSNKITNLQGHIQDRRKKDREQYEAKKYEELQKAAKNCRNLKNLLGIKESINQHSQSSLQKLPSDKAKHPTFSLTPTEADFLNGKMPRGFSLKLLEFDKEAENLQTSEKPDETAEHSPVRQKSMQQGTMNRFVSKKGRKISQSPLEQKKPTQEQPKKYWISYYVIKEIITQMKQSDEIEDFFKYKFSDLCKRRAFRQYYKEYPERIKPLLDLTTIEQMIQTKELKNLLEVQAAFQTIYTNSFIIHCHLKNEYMLKATETFMRTFHLKYNSYTIESNFRKVDPNIKTCEGVLGNNSETSTRATPKTIKLKYLPGKGPEEYEEFLDMKLPDNQHRLKVMNQFLMRIFVNKEGNINALLARMTNLLEAHNKDRPIVSQIHLKKVEGDYGQYFQVPYSNPSDNPLSLSLFYQLKTLLQAHIRLFNHMKKRNPEKQQESLNFNKQQELRYALYPRDQSDDFSIDDDDDS